MKKLCLLFAALVLLCSIAVPVMAAQGSAPVYIAGSTYYDPAERAFLYYVNGNATQAVRSNVADGMITQEPVSIIADAGVATAVYMNGEQLDRSSGGSYQTPGEYVVIFLGGSVPERLFTFTIVPTLTNSISSYALPAGFEIVDATLDGVPMTFEKNYIKLTDEGAYNIRYRCLKTNTAYQLQLQTDFTGPTLTLEDVQEGKARGPVDISGAREAAYVSIYHDGDRISYSDVLTESGEYYIELADEAGNKTTYSFTILIYFDGNSWLFFLLVLFSCVGVVIYLMHSRKNLRVR